MPDDPPRTRRLRAPSPRRFAAGAMASFVAVFGVLALRLHDGNDPSLRSAASAGKATTTASDSSSSSASDDPYDPASGDDPYDSASGDDAASSSGTSSGAVSSTPPASTSAS